MGDKITLNFDESGNLGKKGRYFAIACIEMTNTKPLHNVMKNKAILKTKRKFPEFEKFDEIKASDAYPAIKDYFIRRIASKDLKIRYIVADLQHVKKQLLEDENLLYNFMLKFVIEPVAKRKGLKQMSINIDKRTIKVQSINSFENYIKIRLNYELNLDIRIDVNYLESQNSYGIQAADFIANSVYAKYEFGNDYYYNLFKHKIVQSELFPRKFFGQSKVVNF
ncbi:DUF3800 domain-containing protein [Lederbergia sp. NSJ-179]|uniref:DUF3800 domain-containing protein n=1 Tax=Lederbergia sp. NSJ-179 TaxID=2931402 RepID=UPI001FD11299|nr:DUF3800 domain-containing protein [Lederbergia sp. NSJ-179]MCJ7839991.1 DUF3800 domain-containing protein [Lederbergia sp. NSJ-179]